jgi:hypothetical protein
LSFNFFRAVLLPARFATAIAATTRSATATRTSATAATAEAIATAAAKSAATATLARLTRTSFIHCQSAATHIRAVQSCHGFIRLGIVQHFNKCETTGLTRVAILHDLYPIHLSVCGKRGIKILLGSLERNVPDIYILQILTPCLIAAGSWAGCSACCGAG